MPPICGDTQCNGDDTCASCPGDCGGACCGQGGCQAGYGEDKCTCPGDCGDPCVGKECGDDGCGGICGSCPAGMKCKEDFTCGPCDPDCAGKQCGNDGCGGSCGECSWPKGCVDFLCVSCTPDCDGKQCGDDGCGGSCGTCGFNAACKNGQCVTCTPNCSGKECGDNGCGGMCGSCPASFECKKGVCTEKVECEPNCLNQECGDDGCGGSCGSCGGGQVCNAQGQCVTNKCEAICSVELDGQSVTKQCGPDTCGGYCGVCMGVGENCGKDGFCYGQECEGDCNGMECGSDGCGNPCGYCKPDQLCDEKGTCGAHPCGEVTSKGKCQDKYTLVQCVDLALQETNCKSIENHMCGWKKAVAKFECVLEQACVPSCVFDDGEVKECGPDGCWGSCGICPLGWGCGGGLCKPSEGAECAWINSSAGACIGDVRWSCSASKLYSIDCQALGKKCAWNKNFNFGLGGYDCI